MKPVKSKKPTNRRGRVLLLLTLLCIAPRLWADFANGALAYHQGRYEQAYSIMRTLSEAGNDQYTGLAQYYLGMMHLNGQGARQDYKQAAQWLRKAAQKRVEQAQYRLGNLYLQGNGLPRDYEYAYAWYRVAAAFGHQKSIGAVDKAKSFLSARELAEAEKLFLKLLAKYGPTEEDLNPPTAGSSATQ